MTISPTLNDNDGGVGSNDSPSMKMPSLPSIFEEEDSSYDDGGEGSDSLSLKRKRSLTYVSEEEDNCYDDKAERSYSLTSKKQSSLPCFPQEDDSSSSGEEFDNSPSESPERVLLSGMLSDDSDSYEEKSFADLLRSRRPQRLLPTKPLTLPDPDVLDCPNCFLPLTKPIFQCKNGHLVCSSCCTKLKNKCSFCALPIGDIRCRVMEKVLKTCLVACSNAKYGCKQSTTYGKKEADHTKLCVFAPCSCPVRNCNYIGYYKDLNYHFSATHHQQNYKQNPSEIMSFVFNSRPQFFDIGHYDDPVIFQEEKEGDLIVVKSFKGSNGVYVSANRIAPMVPEVAKLTCSLACRRA